MSKRLKLAGAVVLITGAGNGIGLAILHETLRRGAIPIAVEVDAAKLAGLASAIQERGTVHQADVRDAAAMATVVEQTCAQYGGIDVIIANAGIERVDPIEDMPAADFETVIETNLLGVYRTFKPALTSIMQRRGHIVALSSISALVPFPLAAPYSTSKAAVEMLMRVLRMELNGSGATAGVGFFGFVKTDMADRIFGQKYVAQAVNRIHAPVLGIKPVLTPHYVASKVLDGIERRKARIYAPRMVRMTFWLRGLYAPLDDLFARYIMRRGNLIFEVRSQKLPRSVMETLYKLKKD